MICVKYVSKIESGLLLPAVMTDEMRGGEVEDFVGCDDEFLPLGDGEMMMGIQETTEHRARKPSKHGDTAPCGCVLAGHQSRSFI